MSSFPKNKTMNFYKLLFLLVSFTVLFSCKVDKSSFNAEIIESLKKNNEELDLLIKNKTIQLKNRADEDNNFEQLISLLNILSENIAAITQKVDNLEAQLKNEKGIYLYKGELSGKSMKERMESYVKQGLSKFKNTDKPELEGLVFATDDKKASNTIFFKKNNASELQNLIEEKDKIFVAALEDFFKIIQRKNIDYFNFEKPAMELLKYQLKSNTQIEKLFEYATIEETLIVLESLKSQTNRKILNILTFLEKEINPNKRFDQCEINVKAKSWVVEEGDDLEFEFILSCYDAKAKYKAFVNGKIIEVIDEKAVYEVKQEKAGKYNLELKVESKDPKIYGSSIYEYEVLPR